MTKIANTAKEAWDMQETYIEKPHGWIQWKGTSVCMDIHCACGYHSHIDTDFCYNIKCPKCQRVYMCNGHIELIEIKHIEKDKIVKEADADDEQY